MSDETYICAYVFFFSLCSITPQMSCQCSKERMMDLDEALPTVQYVANFTINILANDVSRW